MLNRLKRHLILMLKRTKKNSFILKEKKEKKRKRLQEQIDFFFCQCPCGLTKNGEEPLEKLILAI